MKKIVSLLLMAAMLVTMFAGCGTTLIDGDKGAVINVYIGSEISDYDPAVAFTDDSAAKFLGLVFEGLTRINEKGEVENALMKSYKIIENEEKGEYKMLITIKATKWSDGRVVSADDVVYAWKRILDPEFSNSAAALLFDIKNARDVKNGDNSIDDLGLAAVDDDEIEVEFEGRIDYKLFLENLASLALVPLREDVVTRYDSFGTAVSTLCTNGPFAIKGLTAGEALMLERNVYYYRDTEEEEALDKYVIPYRLMINFANDEEANTAAYENGEIFYLGEIAMSKRTAYQSEAEITDLLSVSSFMFDTTNKLFSKAEARKGLSMALDRNEIAKIVTYAVPASGLIPGTVYDKAVGDSFRANGGSLISPSADAAGAKSQLSAAGVTSGSFKITFKDHALERAIAEYAKGVWEGLGFKVSLDALTPAEYKTAYEKGDYDVILMDFQCLSTDSFGVLAPFASKFSGQGLDIQNDDYDAVPYVQGFISEEYDALIETAFAEKDRAARSATLHQAEELLMNEMPIIPLVFNQDAYVFNSDVLSGVKDYYYGFRNFSRMKMKDYMSYKETAEG